MFYEDITAFMELIQKQRFDEAEKDMKRKRREVGQARKRIAELDRIFKRIYEDDINGTIRDVYKRQILILALAIFISAILLVKMQNTRYHELGLLSALGFHRSTIRNMVLSENLLLSALAIVFSVAFAGFAILMSSLLHIDFRIGAVECLLSMLGTGVIVMLISILAVLKPLHTEPAQALRK